MRYLLLVVLFAGCGQETQPLNEVKTDNREVKVVHLVTIEDCKVYRFTTYNDSSVGAYHYVTICPKAETTTVQQVSCGRTCTREEAIKALPGMR